MHSSLKTLAGSVVVLLASFLAFSPGLSAQAVIDEQFDDLADWQPLYFPKIDAYSEYSVVSSEDGNVLRAASSASASGLLYTKEFNVFSYPVVRWRWKVENVYKEGNVQEKSGDDYPLRIYIIFKYDPDNAAFGDRVRYGLARVVYGRYPPHSGLNYIWANRNHENDIYTSPYTERSKLIIVRSGNAETGVWKNEKVNILEDYQKAFGNPPPRTASIAVMNDSDNTGESSVSYLDFIQVLSAE